MYARDILVRRDQATHPGSGQWVVASASTPARDERDAGPTFASEANVTFVSR